MSDKVEKRAAHNGSSKSISSSQPEAPRDPRAYAGGDSGGNVSTERTRPHAFVVMPFGQKTGANGKFFDFNAIYFNLIKPALEEAGFEAFRADEETVSGDILTDMFQELLLADLVIADMSIDNANVFYELGVRHAFRKRGVVHIQSGRSYMPFDIFNVRTIPYQTTENGLPDPEHLERDMQAIIRVVRDTWSSDQEAVHSPIFNLLTGLPEPDRRDLRTPLATGFWREYSEWRERVEIAKRAKRIGDILLLTEEISNPLIKEEAISEAGRALRGMGWHCLALLQYQKGLELNSRNLEFRRNEAFHLNRLGRVDEAIVKLENFLEEYSNDSEAIGLLGRIYKDMWQEAWRGIEDDEIRKTEAFENYHWLVKSFHTYLLGYRQNLNDTYPGTNAHTLAAILEHLFNLYEDKDDPDPDIMAVLSVLPELRSTLAFSLEQLSSDENADYWILVSYAELKLFTASRPIQVTRAYRKALIAARKNTFYLQSSLSQLAMLKSLGIRPEYIEAGRQVIDDEIARIRRDRDAEHPDYTGKQNETEEQAIYFIGHSLDTTAQKIPRFGPELEEEARHRIREALDAIQADHSDIAFVAGCAAGSTFTFIEECLPRNMQIEIHLPFDEADYLQYFVDPFGEEWSKRYYALRNHAGVTIRQQADYVGKIKAGINPYERNDRWAMFGSLMRGIGGARVITVWDGLTTADQDIEGRSIAGVVKEMRHLGIPIAHINPTKFSSWSEQNEPE